jgi:molecular chaperone GrpE
VSETGNTEEEFDGPVVRDRRRIDPVTGQARPGAGSAGKPAGPATAADEPSADALASEEMDRLQKLADERTADLQRLQAEYVNYRRRVDRDRAVSAQAGIAKAATELLPVLDDIARADQHGELTGGFKAVADSLTRAMERMGITSFGEVGEPFDPTHHEALMFTQSSDVDEPTATAILQPGYRLGERILRPARVAVTAPEHGAPEPALADPTADEAVVDAPVAAGNDGQAGGEDQAGA